VIKEQFLSWGMLMLSVLFNVYGVFVIKLKLNELGEIKMDSLRTVFSYFIVLLKSPLVISGVFLFFIAPFLFAIALSRMEITIAYPAQIGLNFIILIILALLFLGEQFDLYKGVGILLILAGILVLNKFSF